MCIIACISGRNSPCLKNFSGPYFLGFGDICSNFEIHKYLTLNRINFDLFNGKSIIPIPELEPGFYTIELSIDKNIFAGDLFIE